MSVMISQLPPRGIFNRAKQIPIVQNSTTVRATAQAIADLGAGASFGNPTAQIGLSPVNGVAATAMRSDAAPVSTKVSVPHGPVRTPSTTLSR